MSRGSPRCGPAAAPERGAGGGLMIDRALFAQGPAGRGPLPAGGLGGDGDRGCHRDPAGPPRAGAVSGAACVVLQPPEAARGSGARLHVVKRIFVCVALGFIVKYRVYM